MEGLWQDIRYAARKLVRQPGFTIAALLTLALGMGANSVLFTLVNALLLRPPAAVAEPDRLVTIFTADYSSGPYGASSYPDVAEFAKASEVLSGVAAYGYAATSTGDRAAPQRVGLELISPNYFDVLGVSLRGRSFTPEEAATGAQVAVVSHDFWLTHMDARTDALGQTILLNTRPLTVVAVAPEGFRGSLRGVSADAWIPASSAGALGMGESDLTSRGSRSFFVVGRLRPNASVAQAQRRMNVVASQLFQAYPENWSNIQGGGRRITVRPESASRIPMQISKPIYGMTALLAVIAGLVLLICCANVAGLMIARATALTREIGIRLSIGASRGRIARLMMVESTLLSVAAAVIGLVTATWIVDALLLLTPRLPIPIALDVSIDARVIAFTGVVALLSAIIFGLGPALRASRADLSTVIKSGMSHIALGRTRFSMRSMLVGGQVAASVLLLIAALVFMRSMRSAFTADLGFDMANVAVLEMEPEPGYEPGDEGSAAALAAMDAVRQLPGVTSVSWSNDPPLNMSSNRRSLRVEGYEPRQGEDMEFHFGITGPAYARTLGIPVNRGRDFTENDRAGAPLVVMVNEAFASRFWPDADPIGRRLSFDGENFATVVGVTTNASLTSIGEVKPYVYIPDLQNGWWGTTLMVRGDNLTPTALTAIRDRIAATSPRWNVRGERLMSAQVASSILPQRIAGGVLSLFGVVALLLASIGLYGVIAYAVAQRTHEFGIRFALGATTRDIMSLMMGQGMRVVAFGAIAGVALSALAISALRPLLLGMSPLDPVSFLAVPALLAVVGLVATVLPARRAAHMDPLTALRSE